MFKLISVAFDHVFFDILYFVVGYIDKHVYFNFPRCFLLLCYQSCLSCF